MSCNVVRWNWCKSCFAAIFLIVTPNRFPKVVHKTQHQNNAFSHFHVSLFPFFLHSTKTLLLFLTCKHADFAMNFVRFVISAPKFGYFFFLLVTTVHTHTHTHIHSRTLQQIRPVQVNAGVDTTHWAAALRDPWKNFVYTASTHITFDFFHKACTADTGQTHTHMRALHYTAYACIEFL